MVVPKEDKFVAFVWPYEMISPAVADLGVETGCRVIFDISGTTPAEGITRLINSVSPQALSHIKISAQDLLDPGIEELARQAHVSGVWVELHPVSMTEDPSKYFSGLSRLKETVQCFPVMSDINLIDDFLDNWSDTGTLAIKGAEASGFVSSETTLILFNYLRSRLTDESKNPEIIIWGGVATSRAAAALLCSGASGIVCESAHWLTDLMGLEEETREKIAKLKPDHTNLVGLNLDTPCRLFNKGNSLAVKELKEFAGSLCGAEIRDEQRRFFAAGITSQAVPGHKARYARDQIIPLGVEASFAASFVERYGESTKHAILAFLDEIQDHCDMGVKKSKPFEDTPVPEEFGTRYPIAQGAMSWISDSPEFALKVAQAGGLPTLALGLMDEQTLRDKLGNINEIMGDYPYAINVVALAENPFREVQFKWLAEVKPRFAVIAAGEPSHAKDLASMGIESIYIAPNEELLKMAFEAGVNYVICEGNEAGGHVGEHSSLTLAQMIIDLKRREPLLFEGKRIILAGGIYDRTAGFMASMLGADAVQMGTAYLTTKEIVETRALTALYQKLILEADAGGTVVTGEGVGLRVRSLKTPRMDSICSLERDFAAGSEDELAFRQKLEALSAGSLQVAARGRHKDQSESLSDEECLDQGQFMSGACAGALDKLMTIEELHREVAEGSLGRVIDGEISLRPDKSPQTEQTPPAASQAGPVRVSTGSSWTGAHERIAITGMSVVNSLAEGPEEVWEASLNMGGGISEVPPSKWNHDFYYDPKPRAAEKTYCRVAAFQSLNVDRKELGIPPQDFRTMTESTRISLWLANKALAQSGILESDLNPERISVLISQNSGEAAGTLEDVIVRAISQNIVSSMGNVVQLDPELTNKMIESVKQGRLAVDDTTLLGRLNCAAGGFICNKYGFQGPSFSVSAACATALVALWSAYQMIRNGIIDAAIVGGAEELLTPLHFLEFSAIGALAGRSGQNRPPHEMSRPFDRDRDGMVLGEGGGMLVIERESTAKKRGARPLAYITSMGASNNHLGMVESSRLTQEIAIKSSFRDLPYGPEHVDMIECHATSTAQGDIEEVLALKSLYPSNGRTWLTSFKSQIGHTLGASGVNSLIRGVMAMNAGIYPPTINCDNPDPALELDGKGLSIAREPEQWTKPEGAPRRFQVNAFGFGGSNYVVQLEQAMDGESQTVVQGPPTNVKDEEKPTEVMDMPDGVHMFESRLGSKTCRLGVVAPTEDEALDLVRAVEPMGNGGPIAPKRLRALARTGVHVGLADDAPPALAFVFPGQGSHYAGMGKELYESFPIVREWMDRAAQVADFDLLKLLFHDREEDLQKTRWQQPALFTLEYAMVRLLTSLGIRPTAMAGHSLGELTALCLAGVYSFEDGFRIVNKRAICMDKACEMNIDPGVMMAVDAPLEYLEDKLKDRPEIYITNINSPHQVVLGGGAKILEEFGNELKKEGYRRTLLRVSMAFHSPIMECIHDELDEFLQGIEFHGPEIPVISNTTMAPFPSSPSQIKKIVMAHLESPVHWMQNVRTLWNDYGIRMFVEVGPRDILSNLIGDSIQEAECVQTCLPSAEALVLRTALAQLYAKGNLNPRSKPRFVQLPGAKAPLAPQAVRVEPPAPLGASTQPAKKSAPVSGETAHIEQIIQGTINSFIMESFGRFIKPALLEAIKREHDPSCTEEKLDGILESMYSMSKAPGIALSAPSAPPTIPLRETAAATSPVIEEESRDFTEMVISIIMEATGYERDEIEPDMDLREDLSIRSSRLPVIMDAMEDKFHIKIDLEDFMDARTIQDIADRISSLAAPETTEQEKRTDSGAPGPEFYQQAAPTAEVEQASLKRLVFAAEQMEEASPAPVELDSLESMAALSATGGTGIRKEIAGVFRRDYGLSTASLCYTGVTSTSGDSFVDLLDPGADRMIREKADAIKSWSGIALIIDERLEDRLDDMTDVVATLKGFFRLLQTFMESKTKKFAIVLRKGPPSAIYGRILWQSITAMFLSAAQEYSSVQFRSVQVDGQTDLRSALRAALDKNRKPIEHVWDHDTLYTPAASCSPIRYQEENLRSLNTDDTIIVTGGGYGIAPRLAQGLGELGCKLALIGRTKLDDDFDYGSLVSGGPLDRQDLEAAVINQRPGLHDDDLERAVSELSAKLEIAETLETFRKRGIRAQYFSCDVTDSDTLSKTIKAAEKALGPITGVVSAAGLLRDSYLKQMSPQDFELVVNVKLMGAWNLINGLDPLRLKFFACLSSAAAVQGNPGQVNYAAANRGMSELMRILRERYPEMLCKALFLPPIEGAGMAEDPEIRAWMNRMNAKYVHVDELAELFLREIIVSDEKDPWVLFLRRLPDLPTVKIDQSDVDHGPGRMRMETVSYATEDFPMVDSVLDVDFTKAHIRTGRAFSQEKDPWLLDHMPFKFLKNPPVSAIMALESFMETCKIMFPHLKITGVRDAMFLDIIECPRGVERVSEVHCRRIGQQAEDVRCKVTLETWDISPSGRLTDRKSINYEAVIVMGGRLTPINSEQPGFPVLEKEFKTGAMNRAQVQAWYDESTRMQGRYRIMERVFGTGNGAVKGEFFYKRSDDFAPPLKSNYQYSPYLLEALMQLVNFYIIMEDSNERRSMIPYRIGELILARQCRDNEKITLEARLKKSDPEGIIWDARAVDEKGNPLMLAKDLHMRWFIA